MRETLDLIRRSKFLGRSFIFSASECSQGATSKLEFSNDVLKNTGQQAKIIKTNPINFSHLSNGCEGAANTLPTKYMKTHFPLTDSCSSVSLSPSWPLLVRASLPSSFTVAVENFFHSTCPSLALQLVPFPRKNSTSLGGKRKGDLGLAHGREFVAVWERRLSP